MLFGEKVRLIEELFNKMHNQNASSYQIILVNQFRENYPDLNADLDFCFEVLAGKHKLGFTMINPTDDSVMARYLQKFGDFNIKDLYDHIVLFTGNDKSEDTIYNIAKDIPLDYRAFFLRLFNREYRLGYSNKAAMLTDKHCMLAKTYPEGIKQTYPKQYYIQEKLNGNRCIAYYEDNQWKFISRSQKPLNVNFDMTGLPTDKIFDGEIMTRNKMSNKDFSTTSGIINSKYGDKSGLIYFIYDILDSTMNYDSRYRLLLYYGDLIKKANKPIDDVVILKTLAFLTIYPNPEYNSLLDQLLDEIVDKGGEGVMLRDPEAPYYHSKNSGDRPSYLLKYKKTKTCDLRIVGWNEGNGKYEGMIGSFICEDDEQQVRVSVAGMVDAIRMSDPKQWLGKIIEVAYFEGTKAKNKTIGSLLHPRMKGVRNDKTETSLF